MGLFDLFRPGQSFNVLSLLTAPLAAWNAAQAEEEATAQNQQIANSGADAIATSVRSLAARPQGPRASRAASREEESESWKCDSEEVADLLRRGDRPNGLGDDGKCRPQLRAVRFRPNQLLPSLGGDLYTSVRR